MVQMLQDNFHICLGRCLDIFRYLKTLNMSAGWERKCCTFQSCKACCISCTAHTHTGIIQEYITKYFMNLSQFLIEFLYTMCWPIILSLPGVLDRMVRLDLTCLGVVSLLERCQNYHDHVKTWSRISNLAFLKPILN